MLNISKNFASTRSLPLYGSFIQNLVYLIPMSDFSFSLVIGSSEYSINWLFRALLVKSKGLFKTELYPLHYASLPNLKLLGYKIRIPFSNNHLVRDKNKYATKFFKLTLSVI